LLHFKRQTSNSDQQYRIYSHTKKPRKIGVLDLFF